MYSTGDTFYHHWGEVAGVQFTAGTWIVEYGRGFIPSTLGFGLCDSVFSTMDFIQIFKILKLYARSLMQETLLQFFETIKMLKQ